MGLKRLWYRIALKAIDLYHVTLYTLSVRGQDIASDDTWPFWLQKKHSPTEYAYMADSVFLFVFVGFAIWE